MIEAYLFPEIEWISDQTTLTTLCIVISDIPHSTNDSAVNTRIVVQNPHSTNPPSTNPHGTQRNASKKSAQKL